jgi:putative ABC transport system permease protein
MGGSIGVMGFGISGRPELPPGQVPLSHVAAVSPGFFEVLGVPIVRGREFDRRDAVPNAAVVVINEAMARREFTDEDPIGQRMAFGPGPDGEPLWLEIVGVVGNIRQYGIDQPPVPTTFMVHTASLGQPLTILVRTAGDPSSAAGAIRSGLQAIDASIPIARLRPLEEVIGASLTQRRFNMTLLTVFAAIALVLALAGIYGTVAYAVAQRTQELGIRIALGATRREVLRLVIWDGFKPVLLGLAVGLAGAFALRTSLDRLVYGVSTSDPVTFIVLPLTLAVVALLASLVPALRATRVDPMIALRVE